MKQVQYGMVGGDLKALIGEVHRKGIAFDPRAELVCGCFSAIDDLNVECADFYSVDRSRVYFDYKEMAEKEAGKIDFVAICTPNFVHYEIAKCFLEHGIGVMCEKPLCFEVEEAEELADRIAILDKGRIIAEGTSRELKSYLSQGALEFFFRIMRAWKLPLLC